MRVAVALLLAGTALSCVTGPATGGGAWVHPSGRGYAKFTLSSIAAHHFYSGSGDIVSGPAYRRLGLSFYGELGLGRGLEFSADLDGVSRSSFGGATPSTGVGDMHFGLKKSLLSGRWPAAVSLVGTVTTSNHGDYPSAAQLTTPGDIQVAQSRFELPTADNVRALTASFHVSRGSADGRQYANLSAGYHWRGVRRSDANRTERLNDEFRYQLDGGRKLGSRWWLSLALRGRHPVGGLDPANDGGVGYGEGVRYDAFGLGASYAMAPHWSVDAGLEGAFEARNEVAGANLLLGISFGN